MQEFTEFETIPGNGKIIAFLETKNNEAISITSSILKKDGISGFTTYNIELLESRNSYSKRFSEFYLLRQKLCERWPGIYVPNIPPKKAIGNKDEKYIEYRKRQLNKFMNRLWNIEYYKYGPELKTFFENQTDLDKSFKNLQFDYSEILKKYNEIWNENTLHNVDLDKIHQTINEFKNSLLISYNFIKQFREQATRLCKYTEKSTDKENLFISDLNDYEKNSLYYLTNKDSDKLIFLNPTNYEIQTKIKDSKENLRNPYLEIKEWLEDEELDVLAHLDAINSLDQLQLSYEKSMEKKISVEIEIEDKSIGRKSLKNLFGAIKKDANQLAMKKKQLDQDINDIQEIIKIASIQMIRRIEVFKVEKLVNYYLAMKIYTEKLMNNANSIQSLWSLILKEQNIQKIVYANRKNFYD